MNIFLNSLATGLILFRLTRTFTAALVPIFAYAIDKLIYNEVVDDPDDDVDGVVDNILLPDYFIPSLGKVVKIAVEYII